MIGLLLIYGADVKARDNNNRRPSDLFLPQSPDHPGRKLLLYFETYPRTLRHLCRLSVKSNSSRQTVANLDNYPECLKQFLLYDNVLTLLNKLNQ